MEIWKDIEGYEGYFQVSNLGRVKGLNRKIIRCNQSIMTIKEKMLSPYRTYKGYLVVCLTKLGKMKVRSVHRLVSNCFVEGDKTLQVNHIDGNKENNNYRNLEWVTGKENVSHTINNNLRNLYYGAENKTSLGLIEVIKNGVVVFTVCGSKEMRDSGLIPSCVCRCLSGKLKTHKGYTFMRKINENNL